jgi:hypothetical protein
VTTSYGDRVVFHAVSVVSLPNLDIEVLLKWFLLMAVLLARAFLGLLRSGLII